MLVLTIIVEIISNYKSTFEYGLIWLIALLTGRLADHLRTTCCLSFDRTHMLVLDEADKLVEMGFMKDVKFIVNRVREGKYINTCLIKTFPNKWKK